MSLGLTVWVGGVVTQREVQAMEPFLPRPTRLGWRTRGEWLLATFRCQTYWLLATRAAWRVLWQLARHGRYEPAKTDRVLSGKWAGAAFAARDAAERRLTGWTPVLGPLRARLTRAADLLRAFGVGRSLTLLPGWLVLRREFIAVAWPIPARAQEIPAPAGVRCGVLGEAELPAFAADVTS
jgi:hypothetical protein